MLRTSVSPEIIELISALHKSLRDNNESLSTAESITAGGLSNALTIVPGASDIFLGGFTAYLPAVKISKLGVSAKLIEEKSVVSEEVALEMARGAIKMFGSTWAIATTGVAGPGPSDGVPAGAVWVAFAGPIESTLELSLAGEREVVRNATIASAIATFASILRQRSGK